MTATLVTGAGEVVTNEPGLGAGPAGIVRDGAVVIEHGHSARGSGRIAWVGSASRAPAADREVCLDGRTLLPGFVDSHTHAVFAGDRAGEFAARMAGEAYTGGGIATTVAATRDASDAILRRGLERLLAEMRAQGTTTVEIKTGYGQDVRHEERCARIASEATVEVTFLGAHTVPREYAQRRDAYVDLVCGPMLHACAPYVRWTDVFCEPLSAHAFDADEARTVLEAGAAAGTGLRVHANQLGHGPGVQLAVELGAASADHCTYLTDADIAALAAGTTVATLLPGVEFSTRSPYPDARRLLDAGVCVALATDCNPGTSYSSSMPWAIALAVREMGMTPAEAVYAATAGGARALRRDDAGRIAPGLPADLVVLDAPSHVHVAYRPGVPLVRPLMTRGSSSRGKT